MSHKALALVLGLALVFGSLGLVQTRGEILSNRDRIVALATTLCARIDKDIKNAEFTRDNAQKPPSIRSFHEGLIPELQAERENVNCPEERP